MNWITKIKWMQKYIAEAQADGWLVYDNHGSNRFAHLILAIPTQQVLTRRFFYWIPREGEPQKILHRIEAESLDHLPGKKKLYRSWIELEQALQQILQKTTSILMEYSPRCANPHISMVDAGTFELIKELGVDVQSSADVLQRFTSVLDEKQMTLHFEAAEVLQIIIARVWDLISSSLLKEKRITEYDVQNFILNEFLKHNCVTEGWPICAVNDHSALPHYVATKENAREIVHGDYILIDLWCKKDFKEAVYADISRVAVVATSPSSKQQEIFDIVKNAGSKTINFVCKQMQLGEKIRGFEVDNIARDFITLCGFGEYFTHRTGHNIDTHVHGAGVNFDNLETCDNRQLLPGMCFSIEPGIYLPSEFGVRIETNLLIKHDGSVEITGGSEENILCLL